MNRFEPIIRTLPYLILSAVLAVYWLQLGSLYTVPVFDSVRWGGDETWLMREFGNQASRGVMAYPESFGDEPRTDGVLAGSMWIDAVIYGATGHAFFPRSDLVSIGRTVTAILGLLLILSLYYVIRRLGIHPILAASAVALTAFNQGFLWASHSARYDLLTGLTLIWYCFFLANTLRPKRKTFIRYTLAGAGAVLVVIFSRHLLTLALPATALCLWELRIWKDRTSLLGWISGALAACIVLCASYWLGAGEFSLFGRGGKMGSFGFVLGQIPIFRPFSRNVQTSNLLERINLFAGDTPGVLFFVAVTLLLIAIYKCRQWMMYRNGTKLRIAITEERRFFVVVAGLCALSWLLLQGSRPYYLFHIVPLLVIGCALIAQLWLDVYTMKWFGPAFVVIVIGTGLILEVSHALPAQSLGKSVAQDQRSAIHRLLAHAPASTHPKQRILVDVAGLDWALQDTSREILTLDMFQPPPVASQSVLQLRENHIDFVILRSSPVSSPFEPGRALLPHVLDSIAETRDSVLGFFYDDGRSMDATLPTLIQQGLDTLKLYDLRPNNLSFSKP